MGPCWALLWGIVIYGATDPINKMSFFSSLQPEAGSSSTASSASLASSSPSFDSDSSSSMRFARTSSSSTSTGKFVPEMSLPSMVGYPVANPELWTSSPLIYNQRSWSLSRRPPGLKPGSNRERGQLFSLDSFETCEQHDGICTDCYEETNFHNGGGGGDCPSQTAGRPCHAKGFLGVFEAGFCPKVGQMCCVRPNDDVCQAVGGLCIKLASNTTDEEMDQQPCQISSANEIAIVGFFVSKQCPSKKGFSCCRPVNDNLCRAIMGRCSSCPLKLADGSCYSATTGALDGYRTVAGSACPMKRANGQVVGGSFVAGLCPSSRGFMCCSETPDANPLSFNWDNAKRASSQYNDPECEKASGRCTPCPDVSMGMCTLGTNGKSCTQQLGFGQMRPGIFKSGFCTGWMGMMCCVSSVGGVASQTDDPCMQRGGWCEPCTNLLAGACYLMDASPCTARIPGSIPAQGVFEDGLCTKRGTMCCVPSITTNANLLHPASTNPSLLEISTRMQLLPEGAKDSFAPMTDPLTLMLQLQVTPNPNDLGCFQKGGWCQACPDTILGICRNTDAPCSMHMSADDNPTVGKWTKGLCRGSGVMCCVSLSVHPGNPYTLQVPSNTSSVSRVCEARDGVCVPGLVLGQPCRTNGFLGTFVASSCPGGQMCCVRPNDDQCQAMGGRCLKKVAPFDSCVLPGGAIGKYRDGVCPTKQMGFSCCTAQVHPYCAAVGGRCASCPELTLDGSCSTQMVGRACPVQVTSTAPVMTGRFVVNLCPDTLGFMCCTPYKISPPTLPFFRPPLEFAT